MENPPTPFMRTLARTGKSVRVLLPLQTLSRLSVLIRDMVVLQKEFDSWFSRNRDLAKASSEHWKRSKHRGNCYFTPGVDPNEWLPVRLSRRHQLMPILLHLFPPPALILWAMQPDPLRRARICATSVDQMPHAQ